MPYTSRIPQIVSHAALGTQRAVEFAGQEVEFHALSAAGQRRDSGTEVTRIRWSPNRRNPYRGFVSAGAFYTRFSEYGTVNQPARPVLGPAAERVRESFTAHVIEAWRRA